MTTYSRLMEQRQEGFEDGLQQGIQQGSHQAKIETAKAMVLKNIPIDIITACTGLSTETILKLSH